MNSTPVQLLTVSLRCTASFLLLLAGGLLWRAAARVLPSDHPARSFALGSAAELGPRVREATRFKPCGENVNRTCASAWLVALTGMTVLTLSELTAWTSLLWDGFLPGV